MRTGNTAGRLLLVVALGSMLVPAGGMAASVKERLDALERKVDARGLVDMLNRIEQMQRELQQLRGDIELQAHQLQDMQRQQREQYLDIDRRLQQLETAQPATGTVPGALPGTVPGAAAPAVPGATSAAPLTTPPGAAAPAPATAAVVQSTAPTAAEQAEYDTALAVLREGRYSDAALAFQQFLARHPTSSYADNAGYWLGETYYVTRDFDKALKAFAAMQADYPDSEKVADARLKSGYIYYEQKDWKAARRELEAVKSGWPGSTSARLAADRLDRMKKEGH